MQLRKLDSLIILFPVVATLFGYSYLIYCYFNQGYSFESFIVAGAKFVDASVPVPRSTTTAGYDGQFYYRLAIDPFSNENPDEGITLDYPHYRQQRILYPLIVHGLTLGQPKAIPAALVAVNLLALGLIAGLGGYTALRLGKSAWFGLAFALFPGFVVSLTHDLSEILAITFLFLALTILPRHPLCVLFLSLAVLTKETTLLAAGAILIIAYLQKWKGWGLYFVPPSVYALWQLFLFARWGPENGIGLFNLNSPFLGFFQCARDLVIRNGYSELLVFLFILLLGVFVLLTIVKHPAPLYLKAAWIFYSVLVFSLSDLVWSNPQNYLRAISEWFLLAMLILLYSPRGFQFKLARPQPEAAERPSQAHPVDSLARDGLLTRHAPNARPVLNSILAKLYNKDKHGTF